MVITICLTTPLRPTANDRKIATNRVTAANYKNSRNLSLHQQKILLPTMIKTAIFRINIKTVLLAKVKLPKPAVAKTAADNRQRA